MAEQLTEREKLQAKLREFEEKMKEAAQKSKEKVTKIDESMTKKAEKILKWEENIEDMKQKMIDELELREKYEREVLADDPEAYIPAPVAIPGVTVENDDVAFQA